VAVFFEVVMAGELVEGFATKAKRGGRGKFHIAQSLVNTADVLDFHGGQFGEGLAKESIAEVAFGVVGRVFDLAPGFDIANEAGIGEEFSFVFHRFGFGLVVFDFATEAQWGLER
jgi:hypothetical protein